jgi:hypothetical protein
LSLATILYSVEMASMTLTTELKLTAQPSPISATEDLKPEKHREAAKLTE